MLLAEEQTGTWSVKHIVKLVTGPQSKLQAPINPHISMHVSFKKSRYPICISARLLKSWLLKAKALCSGGKHSIWRLQRNNTELYYAAPRRWRNDRKSENHVKSKNHVNFKSECGCSIFSVQILAPTPSVEGCHNVYIHMHVYIDHTARIWLESQNSQRLSLL